MRKILSISLLLVAHTLLAQTSSNLSLLGSVDYSAEANDIWGYVDEAEIEYALVGLTTGFSVVSLENPSSPEELFFVEGPYSTWRDIKVWGNHAYVTNETGEGLLIVDLSDLTGQTYVYDASHFWSAHNIFIDEFGKAYIFGADVGNGGAILLDLTNNPLAPEYLGLFDDFYLHDGMARGDTLWGSAVYEGNFYAIDVSNPANPSIFNNGLAFHATPNEFTHNAWISDDGNTLFTTDEVSGAYIAAYDVSDFDNIQELDRVQSSPSLGTVIPHNTHVLDNFLVTSYYRDGIVVHDATYPNNMLEVAHYDAYSGEGDGFDGSWGAYPWLPSGLILSSEINSSSTGGGLLLVLQPEYEQACYLEGVVTDLVSGNTLAGATIRILTSSVVTSSTNLNGYYFTGIANDGTYDVEYSEFGYFTDTVEVVLENGVLITQNVALIPESSFEATGQVQDINGNGLPNVHISIFNGFVNHELISDSEGYFVLDTMYESNYQVMAGDWGYMTVCFEEYVTEVNNHVLIVLEEGYYDDFTFDFGWETSGTATSGLWERGNPNGTQTNNGQVFAPEIDADGDCYHNAFVTGNTFGGGVGADDVDDGNVILTSPIFDLTAFENPAISYYRWFANGGGWSDGNDSLLVIISNGEDEKIVELMIGMIENEWLEKSFLVSDFLNPTDNMRLSIEVNDWPSDNHLVEAGFDVFMVYEELVSSINMPEDRLKIYPNPANEYLFVEQEGEKFIYSVLGEKILQTKSQKISLSSLPSGMYVLKIGDTHKKFIKK